MYDILFVWAIVKYGPPINVKTGLRKKHSPISCITPFILYPATPPPMLMLFLCVTVESELFMFGLLAGGDESCEKRRIHVLVSEQLLSPKTPGQRREEPLCSTTTHCTDHNYSILTPFMTLPSQLSWQSHLNITAPLTRAFKHISWSSSAD